MGMPKAKMTSDVLFKKTMRNIRIAKDFFRVHLPKELLQHLHIDTLAAISTEQITITNRRYTADITHQIQADLTSQSNPYVIFITEQESKHKPYIALRMLQLLAAASHRALQVDQGKQPVELPLVIAIVFSTAPTPYLHTTDFKQYFPLELQPFAATIPLIFIDLSCLSEHELLTHELIAPMEYTFKIAEQERIQDFIQLFAPFIKSWIELNSDACMLPDIGDYLWDLLEFILTKLKYQPSHHELDNAMQTLLSTLPTSTVGERIMTLSGFYEQKGRQKAMAKEKPRWIAQGRTEGRMEGILQEKREIIAILLEEKTPIDKIAQLTRLDEAMIRELSQQNGKNNLAE